MNTALDHLVVVARDLAQGAAWCEATLGVVPAPGGRHAQMGTHNRLVRLDGAEAAYVEIISIDPDAPPPGRARWFGMDRLHDAVRDTPRLVQAVVRSTNLDMHRWGLVAAGCHPGTTLALQRDTPAGPLRWRITVPDDGVPALGGALPALIQWEGGRHPAEQLPASGVSLQRLTLRGLPRAAAEVLRLRPVDLQPLPGPAVEARLTTPLGSVTLSSP